MEVVKTRLFFSDFDLGNDYLIDTVSLGDAWWLVGTWLEANATGERIPERLVRLTGLAHQDVSHPRFRFLLTNSLPKAVLDGKAHSGYVVATYQALLNSPVPTGTRPN